MKVREMMMELIACGCDVGLHGSCRSFDNAALLAEQRAGVAAACGRPVVSTRQHYLRYHAAATPAAQAAAGLGVDSTQGFNRAIGFRAGTSFPWWCWDHAAQRSLPVLEVPLVVMDTCLFGACGLEYDEAFALQHVVEIMKRVQAVGGVLTLNWHPNHLLFAGWMETYRAILAEAARRDPWCGTLRDIHAHRLEWESRTS